MTGHKISSKSELDQAVTKMDELVVRMGSLSATEQATLDKLTGLVRDYEDRNEQMPEVSHAEILRSLMESRHITAQKLAAETGIKRSAIAGFLSNQDLMTLEERRKIADYFSLKPDTFQTQSSKKPSLLA